MSELADAIAAERRNLRVLERRARAQRAALAATAEALALTETQAQIARSRLVLHIARSIIPPSKERSK